MTINPGAFCKDTLTLAAKAEGPLGPFHQSELLHSMQEVPVMLIGGITDGPKLSSNLSGEVIGADFGKVMYFDSASANVLSFDLVADLYVIKWDQTKRQFSFCDNSGQHFVFKRRGELFVCEFSFLLESHSRLVDTHAESTVLVCSARKNEQMYLKRQVARAKLARTLLRRLAFAPPSVIARMLNQGAVIECPITSTDIVIADKIYGKRVPDLRGKTIRHSGFDTITVEPGIRNSRCTRISCS